MWIPTLSPQVQRSPVGGSGRMATPTFGRTNHLSVSSQPREATWPVQLKFSRSDTVSSRSTHFVLHGVFPRPFPRSPFLQLLLAFLFAPTSCSVSLGIGTQIACYERRAPSFPSPSLLTGSSSDLSRGILSMFGRLATKILVNTFCGRHSNVRAGPTLLSTSPPLSHQSLGVPGAFSKCGVWMASPSR